MSNFDYAGLALKMVAPANKLITDDKGLPGAYVYRAKKMLSELFTGGDASIVHPAFVIDGVTKDGIYFGKFQGKSHNNRIYSLPGEDPTASISLDTYVTYCRNKGAGHHCITAAEWAFLALPAKKNGTQPKGNNDYGKDSTESSRIAIPTYYSGGSIARVATGTGPLTWSDTGTMEGIWDLNGNVWEWIAGIRLVYGELQVIPYNNAAMADVDMGASSNAWKAINAEATSYSDLFITPNGSGTTSGSVKLDYVSSHWQWQKAAITSSSTSSRNATFASTVMSGLSTFAEQYMISMALAPISGDTDYGSDKFYAINGEAERCATRGGAWHNGADYGVFALGFSNPRSNVDYSVGGRPAFAE